MQDTNIQAVETLIGKLLLPEEDIFLVAVHIKPTNNIKVFLDADAGLNIDKCVKINRAMYRIMEEEGWYPDGNFSLEVSSPGIDEPLKLIRQYKKNIGRNIEITIVDGAKTEGKLVAVTEDAITVEYREGKNKKAVILTKSIPFAEVKQTVVLIAF
jgi:ribosome maturation factor RimP